jgi:hypothetical protein
MNRNDDTNNNELPAEGNQGMGGSTVGTGGGEGTTDIGGIGGGIGTPDEGDMGTVSGRAGAQGSMSGPAPDTTARGGA